MIKLPAQIIAKEISSWRFKRRFGRPNRPSTSAPSPNTICPARPRAMVPDRASDVFTVVDVRITVRAPDSPPRYAQSGARVRCPDFGRRRIKMTRATMAATVPTPCATQDEKIAPPPNATWPLNSVITVNRPPVQKAIRMRWVFDAAACVMRCV